MIGTATRVLGMNYRTFTCKARDIILLLYKSLVWPHLEYCIQAWCPYLEKDIELIEKVQRQTTRMIVELRHLPYEERLQSLGFFLNVYGKKKVKREHVGGFKILNCIDNWEHFFVYSRSILRGHNMKWFKPRCRLDIRKFTFSNRVIGEWKSLPQAVVDCCTVNIFKNRLDKYFIGRG